jgi:hypothetical protein
VTINRIGHALERVDMLLARRPWLAYALTALCYCLLQVPKLLVISNFDILVFPLQAIEIARQLMFDGAHLRPALATVTIAPVNGMLIYPPGIYALSGLLGSVRLIMAFHLLVQLLVPLLILRLLTPVTTRLAALIAALLACYYFVNATWWAPDFIIQPMMLSTLLVLGVHKPDRPPETWRLLCAGLLTGMMLVFKQNVGLFFGIMAGTYLFLSSLAPVGGGTVKGRTIFWLLIAGFLAFAPVFLHTLVHWDEVVFYLLPYLLFWGGIAFHFARNPVSFDVPGFLRRALPFVSGSAAIPAAVFIFFSHTVGSARYFASLFALGMGKLALWDKGLPVVVAQGASFDSPMLGYRTVVTAALYLLPALVALAAALRMVRISPNAADPMLRVAALPVMGLLMLFPLESSHILVTKLFLFVFAGLYFLHRGPVTAERIATILMALLLLPVLGFAAINLAGQARMAKAPGTPAMQQTLDLPIEINLEKELAKQMAILEGAVGRASFYVVDSTSGTLWSLNALHAGPPPQYYQLMQPGLVDEKTLPAVMKEMTDSTFVVVNRQEYDRAAHGGTGDPGLDALYRAVREKYAPIASYVGPSSRPVAWHNILDFTVMRRRPV